MHWFPRLGSAHCIASQAAAAAAVVVVVEMLEMTQQRDPLGDMGVGCVMVDWMDRHRSSRWDLARGIIAVPE